MVKSLNFQLCYYSCYSYVHLNVYTLIVIASVGMPTTAPAPTCRLWLHSPPGGCQSHQHLAFSRLYRTHRTVTRMWKDKRCFLRLHPLHSNLLSMCCGWADLLFRVVWCTWPGCANSPLYLCDFDGSWTILICLQTAHACDLGRFCLAQNVACMGYWCVTLTNPPADTFFTISWAKLIVSAWCQAMYATSGTVHAGPKVELYSSLDEQLYTTKAWPVYGFLLIASKAFMTSSDM